MTADTTAQKQRGRPFEPGKSPNPAGRPKGSRNKLGEAFIQALHDDFVEHGPAVIEAVRIEKPDTYLKIVASTLPREVKLTTESDLTDEQLDERIRQLAAAANLYLGGEAGTGDAADGEAAPATTH